MERLIRSAALVLVCALLLAPSAARADDPESDVKVERTKVSKKQKQTLKFLRENRDFLRAQLDRLRQIQVQRDGDMSLLSERHLMFQKMLQDILAAQSTTTTEQARVDQLGLLDSVRQLGDLEAQLDLMESLLGEQSDRLTQLESDFVGRQQTALLVLVQGYPAQRGPDALILESDDGARVRVVLGLAEREALGRGGIAQIYHEFIEPRRQSLDVYVEGDGYPATPQTIKLDPERDRMNFLQLDLAALSVQNESPQVPVSRWAR